MSVFATCGHELSKEEGLGIMVSVKEWSREGEECLSYPVLCNNCFEERQNEGEIIEVISDYREPFFAIKDMKLRNLFSTIVRYNARNA